MTGAAALQKNTEIFLSWAEIHKDMALLAQKLPEEEWSGIVCVTRGGLVPAYIIARHLDIDNIETFCISSYEGKNRDDIRIIRKPGVEDKGKNWLVIDDISDTGATFETIRKTLPYAYYASVYVKPSGMKQTDSFAKKVEQDTWVNFPWEKNPLTNLA